MTSEYESNYSLRSYSDVSCKEAFGSTGPSPNSITSQDHLTWKLTSDELGSIGMDAVEQGRSHTASSTAYSTTK